MSLRVKPLCPQPSGGPDARDAMPSLGLTLALTLVIAIFIIHVLLLFHMSNASLLWYVLRVLVL
jgi:hypothetical protein